MTFLIGFLRAIGFIAWNMLIGLSILYAINWFLFNKKRSYIFGMHIPGTPGFLVRKREWLFTKARDILHDYLAQAEESLQRNGYLARWEKMVRDTVWEKISFVDELRFLPGKWKEKLHNKIADAAKGIVSNILRKTVPRFIEMWRIEHRIDEFDDKFSIEIIYKYWRRYVFKPVLLGVLALNLLIGINNMIYYLIFC
jgi:uncharacterized membrane protein YheB (UPF0754 family)